MGSKVTKGFRKKNSSTSDTTNDGQASSSDNREVVVVCKEEDIADNQMREFPLGSEGKVLLVKQNGKISALGTKCTHYGAPLSSGTLANGRIRCPWHGACFNATTGDIEDFPGLDSLPCYDVSVDDGQIKIKRNKGEKVDKRPWTGAKRDPDNNNTIVVVGGGAAGQTCVETLRKEGFTGRVVLITKEPHLPYDRPKLSKALNMAGAKLALRSVEFYQKADIETMSSKEVVEVDSQYSSLKFANGDTLQYDKLLIATGGKPRTLNVPGADLKNVCYLRTPDDGNFIASEAEKKNVVIIGTSFIGMEVAAFLKGKAQTVSMIGLGNVPFGPVFGEQIGARLKKWYEEKEVKFYTKANVKEFAGNDGKLTGVVLESGEEIPADVCIVAVGVLPSTEFLKESDIRLDSRGFVLVDKTMKTSNDKVYAAGDIASFPLFLIGDHNVSIGHWQMAMAHGRVAALHMLGKEERLYSVPFFWSVMFGKSLRYAGYGAGFDDVIIDGDLEALQFAAFYLKDERVLAVATLLRDPLAAKVAELMLSGKELTKADIPDVLKM